MIKILILLLFSLDLFSAKLEMKSCSIAPGTLGWSEFKTRCGSFFVGEVYCLRPSGLGSRFSVSCEKKRNQKEPNSLECYNEFMENSKIVTEPEKVKSVPAVLGTRG